MAVENHPAQGAPHSKMEITPSAIGGALAGGSLAAMLVGPLGWAALAAAGGFIVGGVLGELFDLARRNGREPSKPRSS